MDFVERHGLWSSEQSASADDVERRIEKDGIEVVRFSFPDQHGILRGKTILAAAVRNALRSGCPLTSTLFTKDTSHRNVYSVFEAGGGFNMKEMEGGADVVLVADPTTFRSLPWSPSTGWILCDAYFPNGNPVPFATRQICKRATEAASHSGYELVAGLEVEFHIFKLEDSRMGLQDSGQPGEPPTVSLINHGYQYLTELRSDQIEHVLEPLRRYIIALGLPLRTVEIEYGPSQCEFTFKPGGALEVSDNMILFRNATKQICRRMGYHATFMCRPQLPNVMSSGWHLHQSLKDLKTGRNAFVGTENQISEIGSYYLGGLLKHAPAATAFAVPTINGYKRFRPYSLAPDRANWGRDNRGVMVRVVGSNADDSMRLENRIGEPAANPYLYISSQIFSGLHGINGSLAPGRSADVPYEAQTQSLPTSIDAALRALREDSCFQEAFGEQFIDYYIHIKTAELKRFAMTVTDWEQREYLEIF
ncbi:glutamine synthetase family protein [Pseudolabrys sp.]|uniref:glutamine synthetase family protein n=1 Tax=Pseudolabrys sp. TaxID=1960880 RepID=UPI003D14DB5B